MTNDKFSIENYKFSRVSRYIYNYMLYLLNGMNYSNEIEITLILIEMIQMLSFIFNPIIHFNMIEKSLYDGIHDVFESFRIIPLFKGHQTFYFLYYYSSLLYVLLFSLMTICLIILLKQRTFQRKWLVNLMRIITKLTISILFIPLLSNIIYYNTYLIILYIDTLISILNCNNNGTIVYTNEPQCSTTLFYLNVSFSSLMTLMLVILSIMIILFSFEIRYNPSMFEAKLSSALDILSLIEKILFVILNELCSYKDIIIICYFIISIIIAVYIYLYNPFYNKTSRMVYSIYHYLVLWNIIVVAIERFIHLNNIPTVSMIVGSPIVILGLMLIHYNNFYVFFYSKGKDARENLFILLQFINAVESYEADRRIEIMLDSYIALEESHCLNSNCHIKKYLRLTRNKQSKIYLLYHAEELFQTLVVKYPLYSLLKIFYFDFLLNQLNDKHKAIKILNKIDENDVSISFYNTFFIYRIINETNVLYFNEHMDDISLDLEYMYRLREFKQEIISVSSLYTSFWNLLPIVNRTLNKEVVELKNIGLKIFNTIHNIDYLFEALRRISQKDKEVLIYYIDYLRYLLSDATKADQYKALLMSLNEEEDNNNDNDNDKDKGSYLFNRDHMNTISALSQSDKYEYIIISTSNNELKDIGIIDKVSFGVCKQLEYTSEELTGQSLDYILPELFREEHRVVLNEKYNDFKHNQLPLKKSNTVKYKTFNSFALTKSKHITPFNVSPCLMANESEVYYFIGRIIIGNGSGKTYRNENSKEGSDCYVITNLNKKILNFTRSASVLLDIHSNDFNKTNISNYVSLKTIGNDTESNEHNNSNVLDYKKIEHNESVIKINNKPIGYLYQFITLQIRNEYNRAGTNNKTTLINDKYAFEKDYLPNNNDQFAFNLNNYSYLLFSNTNQPEHTLPKKVNEIMKHFIASSCDGNILNSESEYSLSSYNNSYSNTRSDNNSYLSSSSINANKEEGETYNNKEHNKSSTNNKDEEDYYHVDTEHIKLMYYNYTLKQFDNMPNEDKPIEVILNKTTDFNTDPNEQLASCQLKKKITDSKSKRLKHFTESEETQKKFISQLKYALSKQTKEREISILALFSLATTIVCIIEGIIIFLFYKDAVNQINTSNLLITSSFDLIINSVVSVYFVRELTLISNKNYIAFSSDKTQYRNGLLNDLYQYNLKSEIAFDQIVKHSFGISTNNSAQLFNTTMKMFIIRDDLSSYSMNISAYEALSITFDAVYHIILSNESPVLPSTEEVYSHVINGLNGINQYLTLQANIYVGEIDKEIELIYVISSSILIIMVFINIAMYMAILLAYFKVEQKKEAYLNVFFEIDDVSIHRLLLLCEQFTTTYYKGSKSLSSTVLINNTDNDNDFDNDDGFDTDGNGKNGTIKDSSSTSRDSTEKKARSIRVTLCTRSIESILIKIFYIAFLSLILILFAILILIANNALSKISLAIKLINGEISFYTKCLLLFNMVREYMFDKNINVLYEPLETRIDKSFERIYALLVERNDLYQRSIAFAPPEYRQINSEINTKNICDFYQDTANIPDSYTCKNGSYGTNELGLNVFISFFIEEIKTMKHLYTVKGRQAIELGFKYNETLFGLKEYDDLFPTDDMFLFVYKRMHPIHLFNSYSHDIVAMAFRYILIPIINLLKDSMILGLVNDASNFTLTYTSFIITYIIFIMLVYLFIWKRIERKLSNMIYSTKSMLSIVPLELLINLKSIESIYGLKDE